MEMTREQVNDNIVVISVNGKIDIQTSPQVKTEVLNVAESNVNNIFLDFSNVTFINSSGLGGLINLLKELKKKGITLSVLTPSSFIVNLFKLTQLDKIFNIYDKLDDVLNAG